MSRGNIRKGKKTRWLAARPRFAWPWPAVPARLLHGCFIGRENWGRSQLPDKQSGLHRGMDAPNEVPAAQWSDGPLVASVGGDHCRERGWLGTLKEARGAVVSAAWHVCWHLGLWKR